MEFKFAYIEKSQPFCYLGYSVSIESSSKAMFTQYRIAFRGATRREVFHCIKLRDYKGDREGIPHIHPIPQVIRLELFLESG